MFFLNDLDTSDVEFKRGRRKGSKNKFRQSRDTYRDVDMARKVVGTGNATSKELRSWVQLLRSFK